MDWVEMVHYQQQMQKLSRILLPAKSRTLTSSECELLAWLYLNPRQNTLVMLSRCSGMKKEAVSRCLKSLFEKGCILKEKQADDERSYALSLTEQGREELKRGYEAILKPFYALWRAQGARFEQFLKLADQIVEQSQIQEEKK